MGLVTPGRNLKSFFLQAELGDDAFDTTNTDRQAGLAEFLGDDRGRPVGVEEAVANDLSDDLVGASRARFGTTFVAEQSRGAALEKSGAKLEVTWSAEAELGSGGLGTETFAFSLQA